MVGIAVDHYGCSVDNDPDRYREEVWGHWLIEQPHLRNLIECGLGTMTMFGGSRRRGSEEVGEMNCHVERVTRRNKNRLRLVRISRDALKTCVCCA